MRWQADCPVGSVLVGLAEDSTMGIRFRAAGLAIGVLLALLLLQSPAKADSFSFSFQSTQGSPVSGSGTFDASPQCTQSGTFGASTITSLSGQLMLGSQPFNMGFAFNPCLNFVSPTGQLQSSLFHNEILFTADAQHWELFSSTVLDPFPLKLIDTDNNAWWPITLTTSAVPTPETSTLVSLIIGLLGLMGLTLLRNRLS